MTGRDTQQHRRTHNILLISKLLNHHDTISPLTLIVDSLEQSGRQLVQENLRRAKLAKTKTIFVSFETLRKPKDVDVFIKAWDQSFDKVQHAIKSHVPQTQEQRALIVIDCLNILCLDRATSLNLPAILASLFAPNVSIIGVYHSDCPNDAASAAHSPHSPDSLTLLRYIATAILTTHSLSHILACKEAQERSIAQPVFGLAQGTGGMLIGPGSNGYEGTVFEMEYRRKSGRGVCDWYFLPRSGTVPLTRGRNTVILLEDHPLYKKPVMEDGEADDDDLDTTFELGLTDKQRKDRDGVVLPYFDAQKGAGGEGGRILYDMDALDDFDEEEDEI